MKKYLFISLVLLAATVAACSQQSGTLQGKWIIETVYGQPVAIADTAFITFEEGLEKVHGCNGCNNFFGPCTVKDDQLKFGELGSTMRFCAEAATEHQVMDAIYATVSYKIKDKTLAFYTSSGAEALRLCREGEPVTAYENDVIKTIMERRSIRRYEDRPVPRELLWRLTKCGINAPSAVNRQQWEVRIVDNPEYIDGITEIYKKANPKAADDPSFKNMFRNAPAVIFIGSPRSGEAQFDCGLLAENIMLAAKSLGLGTCCLGGPIGFMKSNPDAAPYLKRLAFSDDYELLYAIAVGYPDEAPAAKPRDNSKVILVN